MSFNHSIKTKISTKNTAKAENSISCAESPSSAANSCLSQANCANCRLADICLPISLNLDDINKLNEIIRRGRPYQKKQYIYHSGDAFQSVYAVRSGAVKTIKTSEYGIEQITGFHLPGELIGIDGLATNRHTNSALALETASICEIPFSRLEELSVKIPSLQRRFFQLMSKEIAQEQQLITMLSNHSAEQRVAALFISISLRNHNLGFSANEFMLPMSRADIANYLGITVETVSRIFTKMDKQGVVSINKKQVTINDLCVLRQTLTEANQ